ncbi:MAG TPA: biopolymer transporter ExbD [Gemmatimonadaceae bacterium]|nr:biopolymer transporter ExbD [Gemmatimonadaceae bacterium]
MVVAPMLINGNPAVPPQATNLAAHPDEPTDVTLGIDRDGFYFLNKRGITSTVLEAELHRIFASRPDDRVLYLRAHERLDYGVVHEAMDIAARSGARVVALVSELRVSSKQQR